MVIFERCGHGDQKGIRRLGYRDGFQIAFGNSRVNHHIQIRLDDMDFTSVDGVHRFLIYIDANNLLFPRGKNCRGRKSDITEANDRNCFK
ncbi:hypothetical protein AYK87_05315 [Stutzerimonas stutzeri]|nr:hypothetical protein AYK87_05315 [Stutzerimonas stutzeri]